jgi:hypothetical protein
MKVTIRAIGAGILAAVWLGLSAFAWFKTPQEKSESERRKLAKMPQLTAETLLDGSFMEGFADYAVDQFPMRDTFRTAKALFAYYGLQQLDNNGYFIYDGYIVKQTYPLNQSSVNHATAVINKLYDTYLKDTDCKLYMAVVPDKGYYLTGALGYPSMDYESLQTQLEGSLSWATFLDIRDTLKLSDYYRTDTHWRQENLLATAERLCQAMGAEGPGGFAVQKVEKPFYGVYYGHGAVPMDGEEMYLLQSDLLAACKVYDAAGKQLPMYDFAKLDSQDMYEIYLSGNQPLVTIENPNATTDKELVLFRDSFGCSIAPLLVQGYKTVTLVDVRYMNQSVIGQFLTFEDQDVLFLYSTLVLNESSTMKK